MNLIPRIYLLGYSTASRCCFFFFSSLPSAYLLVIYLANDLTLAVLYSFSFPALAINIAGYLLNQFG